MATGDMKNNIKQLHSELRAAKCTQTFDLEGLINGSPQTYLGIYHYLFTTYNTQLNDDISNSNNELYGKSDMRFMEAVYKILRDMFDYKPQINREQFFSPGYAERKVIMATDILKLVRRRYKPPKSTTFRIAAATRVETKISPREKVQQEPLDRPRKIASKSSPELAGAIVLSARPASGKGFKIPKSAISDHRLAFEGQLFGAASVVTKTHRERQIHTPDLYDDDDSEKIKGATAEQASREQIIRKHPNVDQESPDSVVKQRFLDLVSPAIRKVNEKIESLENAMMRLEKQEQPRMISDVPARDTLTTGLTKQMSDLVFKLDTLTSRVVLIENRLMMIEAKLDGNNNYNQEQSETNNCHNSEKTAADSMQPGLNRNHNNIRSHDENEVKKSDNAKRNGERNNVDNIESGSDEGNIDDLKVVVIREDAKEPKITNSKLKFIKELVNRNDLETTMVSDVTTSETSVTKESQQLPLKSSEMSKTTRPQFDDTVSPIRPYSGSLQYANIQDESLVGTPCAGNNSISINDRRSSTPTHFMLDISTLDRVSRISQMMAETKQLLH